MRLVRLSSNMKSFHTVTFKDGINLIVGKQSSSTTRENNTYNGVGKSLIIYIIHFCLGSNKMNSFEKNIPGWEFKLEFLHNDKIHTTKRNTSNQSKIILDSEEMTLPKFRDTLYYELFNQEQKINHLTFNTLFPRFIRRDRESYVAYDTFIKNEQEYSKLLNNSFLLGLEDHLVTEKKRLRNLGTSTDNLKKSMEKDPIIREHFTKNKDTEIEMLDLEENILKLENEISNFKISNNYHHIEVEANEQSFALKELENKRVLISNSIKNINKSLESKPDLSLNNVTDLYNQAKIEVPEMIVKKMEDAIIFQENLFKNRSERLLTELRKNENSLRHIDEVITSTGKKLDNSLEYLNQYGALEDYNSIVKKQNDMKIELERLNEYTEIIKSYNTKLRDIKSSLNKENIETDLYLERSSDLLDEIMDTFRNLSKTFYEKKPGGITINNNEGSNTLRFNITAKIQDDSSDGVNEVKIFCFDMTLLLLQKNHKFEFIFHDSRLFGNMDPRQRLTLFKVANQKVQESDIQYIASINEDTIMSFKDLLQDDEYESLINANTILTLTDESAESKLLGKQIDMDYNK